MLSAWLRYAEQLLVRCVAVGPQSDTGNASADLTNSGLAKQPTRRPVRSGGTDNN
jgi:hypothetical protein